MPLVRRYQHDANGGDRGQTPARGRQVHPGASARQQRMFRAQHGLDGGAPVLDAQAERFAEVDGAAQRLGGAHVRFAHLRYGQAQSRPVSQWGQSQYEEPHPGIARLARKGQQ